MVTPISVLCTSSGPWENLIMLANSYMQKWVSSIKNWPKNRNKILLFFWHLPAVGTRIWKSQEVLSAESEIHEKKIEAEWSAFWWHTRNLSCPPVILLCNSNSWWLPLLVLVTTTSFLDLIILTLYLGLPPMLACILANSDVGRLLPTADTGRLAICSVLCKTIQTTHRD